MSDDLKSLILGWIAAHGDMPLDLYMQTCLTDPDFGYYTTRDPLGARGDFVTAPEISQCFGELIGLWMAETWRMNGARAEIHLVELGPGRGTLMSDMLRASAVLPEFTRALHVHLVEASPALQQKQREVLAPVHAELPHRPRVTWHDNVTTLPPAPLLIVANEFFDALPVRQYVFEEGGWRLRAVTHDPETLALGWSSLPCDTPPAPLPDTPPPREGDIRETCPAAREHAALLARRLATHGGAALCFDYGYTAPAYGDSFQAVARHEPVDPLATPGEVDLTAHVDFHALAQIFHAAGASHRLMEQGPFLRMLGIEQRAQRLIDHADDSESATEVMTGVQRLIAPDAMGQLFKALLVTAPGWTAPGIGDNE